MLKKVKAANKDVMSVMIFVAVWPLLIAISCAVNMIIKATVCSEFKILVGEAAIITC